MIGTFIRTALLISAVLLMGQRATWAHEAETSYLRVRLVPGKAEVRLTFDAFTLQKIAPTLDSNGDGALAKSELAEATPLIQQFLEANVGLSLDGKAVSLGTAAEPYWPLDAPDPLPRASWHDQTGLILFPFDLPLASAPAKLGVSVDHFSTIGDKHRVFAVLEHGGKSQPVILSATRNEHVFAIGSAAEPDAAENAQPSSAKQFFVEGIIHILQGYDHICFLVALLVVARRLGNVVAIVTAFTVAHSITLILAARGIVALPARLIECAIAATIVYVVVENFVRQAPRGRWILTFVFGLIHGFGFANVLAELTLPPDAMITSLLLFNVGVEVGQLAIVAILWPILWWMGRSQLGRGIKWTLNALVGLLGLAWFIDRVFLLEWMPF